MQVIRTAYYLQPLIFNALLIRHYTGVVRDVLTVTSPTFGEYVCDLIATCVAPLPQGPYNFVKGAWRRCALSCQHFVLLRVYHTPCYLRRSYDRADASYDLMSLNRLIVYNQ